MEKTALIAALLEGEEISNETYIFCHELKNLDGKIGYSKFEILDCEQQSIFQFKIITNPWAPESQKNFAGLQPGMSQYVVGMVTWESKTWLQKLRDGLESALTEGRIPFMPS